MAAKCAPSVPVLHNAVWCWWWLRYLLIWVLLSNLPIRNPHNQTQIHQSEYLSMNSTFALCWKEINCRSNGLSILSIWESFTPNLWSPDGGNTIYLLRGPSFNSVGAGSWPVTRHVRASRDVTRRHVTCPRHPQHHVSLRVTVRTAPPPSLMYYYRNYSCLITHYTLHITRYTLQTFLVVTLWQVTSHPPPQRSKYPLSRSLGLTHTRTQWIVTIIAHLPHKKPLLEPTFSMFQTRIIIITCMSLH